MEPNKRVPTKEKNIIMAITTKKKKPGGHPT